ncbi:UNVERIFIED_CONTAM: hypothetical protein K2H54_059767 [Gekko kuhli]
MLKHLEKWFNDVYNRNELYSYSKFYIYKNYSRQMHLHKIYHFILIHCNLHNLSMPTATLGGGIFLKRQHHFGDMPRFRIWPYKFSDSKLCKNTSNRNITIR